MLNDQLSRRMELAAQGPTFTPDVRHILDQAHRRRRMHRVRAAGSAVVLAAAIAVGSIAISGGFSAGHANRGLATAAGPHYAVSLSTVTYQKFGGTCEVLTFTATGAHTNMACRPQSGPSGFPTHDSLQFDGLQSLVVKAGGAPTWILTGEVGGSGSIVVADDTGRHITATLIRSLPGWPVDLFYADLGTVYHQPTNATFSATDGHTGVFVPTAPFATPTPRPPNP